MTEKKKKKKEEEVDQEESSHSHRQIIQIHYTAWPDFGVAPMEDLIDLIKLSREYSQVTSPESFSSSSANDASLSSSSPPPPPPIITHCSAGVGRTGVFIAVDYSLHLLSILKSMDIEALVSAINKNGRERSIVCRKQKSTLSFSTCSSDSLVQAMASMIKSFYYPMQEEEGEEEEMEEIDSEVLSNYNLILHIVMVNTK